MAKKSKCANCQGQNTLDANGACSFCAEVLVFARQRMKDDARYLGNPTKCSECGGPVKPSVSDLDTKEREFFVKFVCVRGCYICMECKEIFLYNQTCLHDDRVVKAKSA
jgi:hypothetical protein